MRNRRFLMLLCLCLALVLLCSLGLALGHTHVCQEDHCPVCLCLARLSHLCKSLLMPMTLLIGWATKKGYQQNISPSLLPQKGRTLLSQKVQLNL